MALFFIGIIEMLIVTFWTKLVTKTKILASGVITVINTLIWFYVLRTMIDQVNNWGMALLYALGCALGTMVSIYYFHLREGGKSPLSQMGKAPEGKINH